MQPYFFPYIGYWQLLSAVDRFVVYDNIQFTKKSWIRRNRILLNGTDKYITLPIKKDSDYLDISERYLSEGYPQEQQKLLNQIRMAYKKAPYFNHVYPLIEECITYENNNLFQFIYYSIIKVANYLDIQTEIIVSSNIKISPALKNKERVIETCKTLNGEVYINLVGGQTLYNKNEFFHNEIELSFIQVEEREYKQFDNLFIPNLSIIDVMMFNSKEMIQDMIHAYKII